MDQAASIFGIPNHALHISFYPKLKVVPTKLPEIQGDGGCVWVIANTLVVSDKKVSNVLLSSKKAACPLSLIFFVSPPFLLPSYTSDFPFSQVSGPIQYNLRVAELSMATYALAKKLGIQVPETGNFTLKVLLETYFAQNKPSSNDGSNLDEESLKLQEFLKIVEENLPKGELKREEVEELTGLEGEEFEKVFTTKFPSE